MYSEKFLNFIKLWQSEFAFDRTLEENVCLDKEGNPIPWYTYPAIEYLSQLDFSNKDIFEFGCGYSSPFWASRAKNVTSIEDNLTWFQKWQTEFKQKNLDLRLRSECQSYCSSIFEDNKKYDIIVIDGKWRDICTQNAIQALNKGGFIILDDSDRINTSQEYVSSINYLTKANLIQIDFYGFCPMNVNTKATSVFLSRDFDFRSRFKVQPINGLGNLWGMTRKNRKQFYKDNI